ncbi:MAG: response regulator transcription factor, partial [Rhodospirillaceae bacterium]|nr:response regulator transcription factor [Rhodospirillaceae bacterium]
GISENTVRVHISAIITALDATNRTEAAYSAMRIGLIPRGTQLLG